jgi:Concanavalin A-like lectin/glucanases superfamily/Secretion system C-terminal sorting domain
MRKIIPFLLMLSFNSIFAQAPTSGLVAFWPLDGNFNDASGNAINGTNFSATSTTSLNGVTNKAMNFANTTATVAQYGSHPITSSLNFTAAQDFTISFWVYFNSVINHSAGIYDNNLNAGGYGIFLLQGPPNIVRFSWRGTQISATAASIPLATWKHFSCVKNGSTMAIYVDGVLNVSGAVGTATPSYPLAGRFGAMTYTAYAAPNNYNGLEGKIDDVRIYNRVLTAPELVAVLPIHLTNFSGSLNSSNKTLLNWQTEYEQNAKDFTIQRSIDNITFEPIGKVNAAGNSNTISKYNFEDNVSNIKASKVYYRLQLNDIDGKQAYSDIVALKKANTKAEISIYPNPANDKIQVQAYFNKTADAAVKIINADGKIVLHQTIKIQAGNNSFPLNVANVEKGNYFLQVETLDEKYVKEVMKL